MSAQVIQFVPKPNPNRKIPRHELSDLAVTIMAQVTPEDTAPSEMPPEPESA